MSTDYNKIKVKRTKAVNPETEEITKREAVAKGRERKPGLLSRAGTLFFGEDGFRGIADHLVHEVFIPSIQNTIADVATNAIQRAIFGDNYDYRRRSANDYWYGSRRYIDNRLSSSSRGRGYTDYNKQYDKPRSRKSENLSNSVRMIEFDTANDANDVLAVMIDNVEQYGLVTVADFYELSDVKTGANVSSKFTDHQFGWTNLDDVRILPFLGGGFYISFPPVETV